MINTTHEGDGLFNRANEDCRNVIALADSDCQRLWDDLHFRRSEIVDLDGEIRNVSQRCRDIRALARQKCTEIRLRLREAHHDMARQMHDLTY